MITYLATFTNKPHNVSVKSIAYQYKQLLSYFSEYHHVLFSNLRVMIHAGSIFDEYFGPNGFRLCLGC